MRRSTIQISRLIAAVTVLVALGVVVGITWAQGGAGDNGDGAAAAAAQTSFAKAFFISQGSLFGTAIIWFLLALSVTCFGFMGYFWLSNRRVNIVPEGIVDKSNDLLDRREYRELLALASRETSFFSAIVSSALREASHGFGAMVRALEQTGEELVTRRMRQIELLNVVGNVAPMIGLFGTVYGMILTFQGIVASGGRPDPIDLAGGIGTALTTTFWGLVVAIPSLAGYAIIRNNIDSLTSEATLHASELINHFRPTAEQQANGAQAAAAAPAAGAASAARPAPNAGPSAGPPAPSGSTRSPLGSAVDSTSRITKQKGSKGGGQSGGGQSSKRNPDAPSS